MSLFAISLIVVVSICFANSVRTWIECNRLCREAKEVKRRFAEMVEHDRAARNELKRRLDKLASVVDLMARRSEDGEPKFGAGGS